MFKKILTVGALVAVSTTSAFAVGPDFSQITAGIDFNTAQTAVIGVGVALAGLYIAIAGTRGVLRMIR